MVRNFRIVTSYLVLLFFSCSDQDNPLVGLNQCELFIVMSGQSCPTCEYSIYNFLTKNSQDSFRIFLAYDASIATVTNPLEDMAKVSTINIEELLDHSIVLPDELENSKKPIIIIRQSETVVYKEELGKFFDWTKVSSLMNSCPVEQDGGSSKE